MTSSSEQIKAYVDDLRVSGEASEVAHDKRAFEQWQSGASNATEVGRVFPIERFPTLRKLLDLLWLDSLNSVGDAHAVPSIHRPFAIELSRGCSLGCWFCCFSADELSGVASFAELEGVFVELLYLLRDQYGYRAREGILYWATDPLDNPDYFEFASRFKEILGKFPETTTALAARDETRTRRLMELSRSGGGRLRFSILSKELLKWVHGTFSPDELIDIELILQFKGSPYGKVVSGRYREAVKRNINLLQTELNQSDAFGRMKVKTPRLRFDENSERIGFDSGSCACVSGPLINLYSRRCAILKPISANDRFPLGYVETHAVEFNRVTDLEVLFHDVIPVG